MNVNLEIASLLGILPGIFLLYHVWGKYEAVVNDRLMVFHLVMGFIVGTVSGILYLWLRAYSPDLMTAFVYLSLLFPVFFVLLVFVLLNRKKFFSHYETMFYGMSLFLGAGAMLSTVVIYRQMSDGVALGGIPIYIVYTLGNSLISMSAGLMLGYGVYREERTYPIIQAVMAQIIYNVFVVLSYMEGMELIMLTAGLFISALVYMHTLKNAHFSLPREVRRELRVVKDE